MSEHNVEIVRRLHEEFNREGLEALWRVAHPDIEFREPPQQPGASVFAAWMPRAKALSDHGTRTGSSLLMLAGSACGA